MEQAHRITALIITKQIELQKHLEEIKGVIHQIQEQITNNLNRTTPLRQGPNEEIQQQLREKDLLLNNVLEAVKSTGTKLGPRISTIKDLTMNIKQLEQQVQVLQKSLGETLENNVTLQRALKDSTDKAERRRAEREANNRYKEELSKKTQTLQSGAETLSRENSALLRHKELMNEQKEEHLTKIRILESKVAELEDEKSDVVREAEAAICVSRQNQERLKNDLDQTQKNNTTLQRLLKDLKDQADRQRAKNDTEREADDRHKEELSKQIQSLQSRVETLDGENSALLREKEQMKNDLVELRQHSANYQAAMATFAHETAQLRQTSQDLCGQLHFLEAQKTESDNNLAKLRQEKETLQVQVVQAVTKNQELRQQANSQVTYVTNLTGAFQAMQSQAMTLQADSDRDRHEAQRLETLLQGTRDLVRSRDENLAALREEILRRDADLEAARTRQRDLESVLRARSVHVRRYQTEVEEGRKTIRILQEEVKLQSFRDRSASITGQ